MLTELFSPDIVKASLKDVKYKINALPHTWQERRSYLLHEYAAITGTKLTADDFKDILVYYNI